MSYKQQSDLATRLRFLALLVSVAYYQKSLLEPLLIYSEKVDASNCCTVSQKLTSAVG